MVAEVYLAYGSEDEATARDVYRALTQRGVDVFFDKVDVAFGEDAVDAMAYGFQDNLAFLLVWSKRAVNGPFFKLERLEAIYNSVAGGTKLIMPLRLDDTPLPAFIRTRSYKFLKNPEYPKGEPLSVIANAVVKSLEKHRRHP